VADDALPAPGGIDDAEADRAGFRCALDGDDAVLTATVKLSGLTIFGCHRVPDEPAGAWSSPVFPPR